MIREEEEEEEESTPSLQRAWCLGNRGPVLRRGAPYCHHLKEGGVGSSLWWLEVHTFSVEFGFLSGWFSCWICVGLKVTSGLYYGV